MPLPLFDPSQTRVNIAQLRPHQPIGFNQLLQRFGQIDFREECFDQFAPPLRMGIDNLKQVIEGIDLQCHVACRSPSNYRFSKLINQVRRYFTRISLNRQSL